MSRQLEQLVSHFQFLSPHNKYNRNNKSYHHLPFLHTNNNATPATKRTTPSILCSDPQRGKLSRHCPTFTVHAASVSGSGAADYSEQLLDTGTSSRKRKIAGIDQDDLLDPTHLADSDSCFCEFRGVHIHYKVCDLPDLDSRANANAIGSNSNPFASKQHNIIGVPMILLHGFGASVHSWSRVMKPLARLIGSKVLAFDRPAFGLTSRVFPPFNTHHHSSSADTKTKHLNPYSILFSVLATLHFIDFLAAEKAVLVGHSAGSFIAVNSYFEAPERVAALILIAPAILAPLTVNAPKKVVQEDQLGTNDSSEGDRSKLKIILFLGKPIVKLAEILSKFAKLIVQAIVQMLKVIGDMLNSLYKKILSAILRSALGIMLVRMVIDKFGIAAVRSAWCDSNQVTEDVLQGYTKPLRAKGWDRALVEFTAAMLTDTGSETKLPLAKRLNQISCPVLIVTGDRDRIVPSWNAERLSRAIPGSFLEVIKNCGHLPHEEKVEEFISVVEKFLQRALGNSKELFMQADN